MLKSATAERTCAYPVMRIARRDTMAAASVDHVDSLAPARAPPRKRCNSGFGSAAVKGYDSPRTGCAQTFIRLSRPTKTAALEIPNDLAGGIVSRRSGHPAAGVSARPAHIKSGNRTAVVGMAENRSR